MKYMVVDLEMNPISNEYKEARSICKNEIIEIGAVALDENYREIGNFTTLVRPQMNDGVERKIKNLTGISTEMLSQAPYFREAIKSFLNWCNDLGSETQIFQWSNNDSRQIMEEMHLKKYVPTAREKKILSNWRDFQKEYGERLGVEGIISLEKAIVYAGVEFEGRRHDALYDAKNEAALLMIAENPQLCEQILGSVIEAFKQKSLGLVLGDMFDLRKMILTA